MEKEEMLRSELNEVEGKIDDVIDVMIEKYGKFVTMKDFDLDNRKFKLVSKYNDLLKKKDSLINSINESAY